MNEIIEGNTAKVFEDKKYIELNYEDIKSISDELIEQNKEAYIALANA